MPGASSRATHGAQSSAGLAMGLWTGWIQFAFDPPTVRQVGGGSLGVFDVSVRIDIVTVWHGSRTLAVVDRDKLRAWIRDPWVPLFSGDLAFLLIDCELCVTVDGSPPHPLPTEAVSQLVRLV